MKFGDLNLKAIRQELYKIHDLKTFKEEMAKLGQELLKLQDHLSPQAKKNLTSLEQRYRLTLKRIHQTQKQFDRELATARQMLERTRSEVEKGLTKARQMAQDQQLKLARIIAGQDNSPGRRASKRSASGTTAARRARKKKSAKS